MMQASLEVVLADNRRQQFLNVLKPLLEPTSFEKGCMRCAVWKSIADERRFRFMTEWQSTTDLDRYLESSRFREVLVAAELSEQVPIFEVHTISETNGFEYVAELLDCDDGVDCPARDTGRKGAAGSGRNS